MCGRFGNASRCPVQHKACVKRTAVVYSVKWERLLKCGCHFVLLLAASWCIMTVTHESGHILCGWAAGGTLQQADVAPWHLPHSNFDPDPQPLVTLWGGPILGALVPLTVALLVRRGWVWFIAYYCVLANGSYLAVAWFTGERPLSPGDTI